MNQISIKTTGYVEVIATQCGSFVTLAGSGLRLSTREEIEQEVDDLVRTKSYEYLDELARGGSAVYDPATVRELRDEGLDFEEIALQMAEDIREELSVVYAGIDVEGRAWELDESTREVLRELRRPDR